MEASSATARRARERALVTLFGQSTESFLFVFLIKIPANCSQKLVLSLGSPSIREMHKAFQAHLLALTSSSMSLEKVAGSGSRDLLGFTFRLAGKEIKRYTGAKIRVSVGG